MRLVAARLAATCRAGCESSGRSVRIVQVVCRHWFEFCWSGDVMGQSAGLTRGACDCASCRCAAGGVQVSESAPRGPCGSGRRGTMVESAQESSRKRRRVALMQGRGWRCEDDP